MSSGRCTRNPAGGLLEPQYAACTTLSPAGRGFGAVYGQQRWLVALFDISGTECEVLLSRHSPMPSSSFLFDSGWLSADGVLTLGTRACCPSPSRPPQDLTNLLLLLRDDWTARLVRSSIGTDGAQHLPLGRGAGRLRLHAGLRLQSGDRS